LLYKRNYFPEDSNVINTMAIDRDQLLGQLDEIKSRTKSSVELTTHLIDQSFLRFKASHRTLYEVRQSQQMLDQLLNTLDSGSEWGRASGEPVVAKKRPAALKNSGRSAANIMCGHCEGILLNRKAYRVWTEESGLILLDMIVCYACKLEAQKLGLNTDQVKKSVAPRKNAGRRMKMLLSCSTTASTESSTMSQPG
jgi:hypothetical protein